MRRDPSIPPLRVLSIAVICFVLGVLSLSMLCR